MECWSPKPLVRLPCVVYVFFVIVLHWSYKSGEVTLTRNNSRKHFFLCVNAELYIRVYSDFLFFFTWTHLFYHLFLPSFHPIARRIFLPLLGVDLTGTGCNLYFDCVHILFWRLFWKLDESFTHSVSCSLIHLVSHSLNYSLSHSNIVTHSVTYSLN